VSTPLVTVVVPTKDSGRTLERCLRSIRAQEYQEVELIVVDNHSTDQTWEIACRLADVALRAGPERSAQRNVGISAAKGEYVLWIDSDMELPPDVISDALATAERSGATAVFIGEATVGEGYWTACRALERQCYVGRDRIESPRLVRREYFERRGGFLTSLAGTEDAELRNRMLADGSVLAHAKAMIVHDEGRLTLSGVIRKRFYYGRGLTILRRAHPGAMSRQAGATLGALAANWRLLGRRPWLAAGVVTMRAAEAVAYFAGAASGGVRSSGAGRGEDGSA
jgi:glycosyltransferase involved in cell wall biosynthesis